MELRTVELVMVAPKGDSLPISIRSARERVNQHTGNADPVWDTAFTTKFSVKPPEDAPLVTPMGSAKVVHDFLSRVEEINWLASTQHLDLATTQAEMKANGIAAFSLSAGAEEDMEAGNIATSDVSVTHYAPDAAYAAAMSRRIEWERYIYGCGPVHKVEFAATKDGGLGIVYSGKEKDPEGILARKRAMKAAWLDSHDSLPNIADIENERARHAHYGKAVLATMNEDELKTHRASRMFGNEDPNPGRIEFHAEDLRGVDDRGYAGPRGFLGLDDEDDDEFEYPEDSDSAE